jgi:hypothetical protein
MREYRLEQGSTTRPHRSPVGLLLGTPSDALTPGGSPARRTAAVASTVAPSRPAAPSDRPGGPVRIAFLGTPEVAVPALEALVAADDVEVVAVLTNPDRPKGRSRTPVPPPVKVAAEAHGLPVWQPPSRARSSTTCVALDLDACAVVAYGALLPGGSSTPAGGGSSTCTSPCCPRWRGAAPVQHALRAATR